MIDDTEGRLLPGDPIFRLGVADYDGVVLAVPVGTAGVPHAETARVPEDRAVVLDLLLPWAVWQDERVPGVLGRPVDAVAAPCGPLAQEPVVEEELLAVADVQVAAHLPRPAGVVDCFQHRGQLQSMTMPRESSVLSRTSRS